MQLNAYDKRHAHLSYHKPSYILADTTLVLVRCLMIVITHEFSLKSQENWVAQAAPIVLEKCMRSLCSRVYGHYQQFWVGAGKKTRKAVETAFKSANNPLELAPKSLYGGLEHLKWMAKVYGFPAATAGLPAKILLAHESLAYTPSDMLNERVTRGTHQRLLHLRFALLLLLCPCCYALKGSLTFHCL